MIRGLYNIPDVPAISIYMVHTSQVFFGRIPRLR